MVLESIRSSIGEYILFRQRFVSGRQRIIMNIEDAKSYGIIYNADKEENVELVRKYTDILRFGNKNGEQNIASVAQKKVTTLGFMNRKELPVGYSGSMEHQYFSRKEINWYGKPATKFIHNFVHEPFDILFDFNITRELPLAFISYMSLAKCKAGRYSERYGNLYDVMIEMKNDMDLKFFAENMYKYLQLINRK